MTHNRLYQAQMRPTAAERQEFFLNFLTTLLTLSSKFISNGPSTFIALSRCDPPLHLHVMPFTTIWGLSTRDKALLPP